MTNDLFGEIKLVPVDELPAHLVAYEQARKRLDRFRDDGEGDGPAGAREPRRPSDSPPGLAAELDG